MGVCVGVCVYGCICREGVLTNRSIISPKSSRDLQGHRRVRCIEQLPVIELKIRENILNEREEIIQVLNGLTSGVVTCECGFS